MISFFNGTKEGYEEYKYVPCTSYGNFAFLTTNTIASGYPKPKEVIYLNNDQVYDLFNIIPSFNKKNVENARKNKDNLKGEQISTDIILAGTLPSKDIQICFSESENEMYRGQIMVMEPEEIMNAIKVYRKEDPDKAITIGAIKIECEFDANTKSPLFYTFQCPLRISSDIMHIDWFPMLSCKKSTYDLITSKIKSDKIFVETFIDIVIHMRDVVLCSWIAIQMALLNPVIKERFTKETIPAPEDNKKNDTKTTKTKKSPKRYIKRITMGDISDIKIGEKEKGHHQMSESFWWVSGHIRNQKTKDGHKLIFIQGYWKGPLRETAEKLYDTPRERELILEDGGK